MSGVPSQSHEIVDGLKVSVATIGRDARGELVVHSCNDAFLQMTGFPPSDLHTFPVALISLIPEHMRAGLSDALHACFALGKTRNVAYRDGSQTWRLSLQPIRHASGAASAADEILVSGFNDTPKRQLTHELEVSASRFRAVVDSAYDAIVTIDEQRRITLFNRAAENLFGYTLAEVLGRPIEILLPEKFRANHPRNVRQFADSDQMSLRAITPPRMDETNSVFGRHRDGSIIPVEIAISKISVNGVVEFTAVVRDITERAQLMELLRQQAATDALTGLPNRREFIDFLERELRIDDALSVFILDIDSFKKINDSYGHDIGDEVLRVLANAGLSMPHASRIFARWGGEEFVAALPGADARLALSVAEALRARVEQQEFEHAWRVRPIPFTVSIGVVTREAGERDVDALMRRADRALYQAKEAGRNRVEVG